jgi:hypothetical protein
VGLVVADESQMEYVECGFIHTTGVNDTEKLFKDISNIRNVHLKKCSESGKDISQNEENDVRVKNVIEDITTTMEKHWVGYVFQVIRR